MAFIDIILGALLAYGVIRGIWNGFFIELASLLSLLVGIWAAIKFSHLMRAVIENHLGRDPKTIQITAFVLTFIIVVIAITLMAKALTTVASIAGLGLFNKFFGGFFGVIKMALIISVTLNLFAKINDGGQFIEQQTIDKSLFYNPIQQMAAKIYPTLENWYNEVRPAASTSTP